MLMLFFAYSSSAFGGNKGNHSRIVELTEASAQFGIFVENPGDDFTLSSLDEFILPSWTPNLSFETQEASILGFTDSLSGRNDHHLSYRSNAP